MWAHKTWRREKPGCERRRSNRDQALRRSTK